MTSNKLLFHDGSSIKWEDRQTLKYEEKDSHMALIWVDDEPGFFSRGMVLMTESLDRWRAVPDGHPLEIEDEKRQEIIEKVKKYYRRKSLRISNERTVL